MNQQELQIIEEHIRAIAKSRNGRYLIAWMELIVSQYADVRNKIDKFPKVSFEARADACQIIDEEIVKQLKHWSRPEHEPRDSGDDLE